jgi:hypothetical protein
MTATLVAKGLAGGYAARTLFDSLDLTVSPSRRSCSCGSQPTNASA